MEREPDHRQALSNGSKVDASTLHATTDGGISLRLWQMYGHVWLVCLGFPIAALAQQQPDALQIAEIALALIIFAVLYLWLMRPHPIARAAPARRPLSRLYPVLLFMTLLVLSLSVAYGSAFLWLLVGTSAVAGKTLPTRQAHLVVTLLPLLALGAGILLSGGLAATDWLHIIPLVLLVRALGLDMTGLALLSGTIRELHTAREALAQRSVIAERLRLARDLHDLLGHTLSLITLKSELARRLINTAPARAASEMQEVEQVARQTLREVREAVAGYRQPTLAEALDNAQQVLAAAGIEGIVERRTGALTPPLDVAVAWVVREGVTNVIRHSRARRCTIRVLQQERTVVADITNDGNGAPPPYPTVGQGSGLTGLTERVLALGGHLEAGPFPREKVRGFRLRVELPCGRAGAHESEA